MKPTIVLTRGLAIAALIALALAVSPGIAQPGEAPNNRPLAAPMPLGPSIPIQGRLTDAAGHPLPTGSYDVAFEVCYRGGACPCADAYSLSVEDGLFSAVISDCTADLFDGQQLDLQITVEGETLSPRQPIYASPFAWSLKPGAIIHNYGSGRALSVIGSTSGGSNSALYAENSNLTSGIAIWGKAAGDDATVVIENLGTGALLKGFGADAGEDEFRIGNNGAIQSKTNSYIFVPGLEAQVRGGSTLNLSPSPSGAVTISPGTVAVPQHVVIPVVLPAVLYGQAVKVEAVAVSYRTSYSGTYISATRMYRQQGSGSPSTWTLADDTTDRTSTSFTNYTVFTSGQNLLDSSTGFITVDLEVYFDAGDEEIVLGGIAVRLWHHSLGPD